MQHMMHRPPDFVPAEAAKRARGLSKYFTLPASGCQVDFTQPLADRGRSGRVLPWSQHRAEADLLAVIYDQYNPRKADRLRSCAPRLLFRPTEDGGQKLDTAWFCRVRLCPTCQWRRSLKLYGQISEIRKAADQQRAAEGRKPYRWLLLTLTVRNVDGLELADELNRLTASWHRLIKRKEFVRAVKGWQRSTEVTHNHDLESGSYDTYHPHYHALLCVNPSYFTSRAYITHDEWVRMWRECARLDYDPSVDIRPISGDLDKALAEVAKYTAKPSDYLVPDDLDMSLMTVMCLDHVLDHRRLVAWGGVLKDIRQRLELDDAEEGDLVHTGAEDGSEVLPDAALRIYSWAPAQRAYYREVTPCPERPETCPQTSQQPAATGNEPLQQPRGATCAPPAIGAASAPQQPEPATGQASSTPASPAPSGG